MSIASKSFTSIRPVQRAQEVRDQLVKAIERGDYAPGERLPSERELGEALGVSRVSVREAISGLEAIGLIKVEHGRGCFVAEGPGERYKRPFADWIELHRDEVLELTRVRGALDELAAQEAALRQDARAIAKVRRASEAFRKAVGAGNASLNQLVQVDIDFHLAIANASGSKLLIGLLEELNNVYSESRQIVFNDQSQLPKSAKQHTAIVRAIEAGDARAAQAAVARHIQSTIDALARDAATAS